MFPDKMANQYLVFILDGHRYALCLPAVDRVVHMVHITPLPSAPDIVLGVINVEGRLISVIDIRERFNLPKRKISLSDRLICAHTHQRPVALVVDAVAHIVERSERNLISAENVLPSLRYLEGIMKSGDGLILIHDLNKFLSLEEEKSLDLALATA
jgi:purine-binding chemotaxis protein CheW